MDKQKLTSILNLIAGILFFITAFLGKNYVFIAIGCCFIVLGIANIKKEKDK